MPRKSFSELTPEEVLLLAIDVEKANGARLRVFADLFTDFSPEAAGFFAQLAFEEEQRSRQLEKAYELRHGEHRRAVPEVDLREFIEPYDLDDAEHQVFDSLSLRSALESLLSMKCKARAFYGQALEKADEPKLQALFRELVDFEAEHVQWIEARLDALGGPAQVRCDRSQDALLNDTSTKQGDQQLAMSEETLRPERHGDVTILSLGPQYGALDESVMQSTREFLLELATKIDPPKLLIDFRETHYIDSMMLELLFRVWNRLTLRKGQFALCNLQELPSKIIRMARLHTLWKIYAAREDALAALAKKEE